MSIKDTFTDNLNRLIERDGRSLYALGQAATEVDDRRSLHAWRNAIIRAQEGTWPSDDLVDVLAEVLEVQPAYLFKKGKAP